MESREFYFGLLTVLVLLGLAGYFSWRQIQTLKRVKRRNDISPGEAIHLRKQAKRRLICSALMALFAGCLVGTWFLESDYKRLFPPSEAQEKPESLKAMTDEQRSFLRFFTAYWIVSLLVLLAFFLVAAMDLRVVLSEGARKHRQLRDNQNALLEKQLKQYHREKNGHG